MSFFKMILALLTISFGALASADAQKAALEYQQALDLQDKSKLKNAVTKEYYKKLSQNRLLERLFKSSAPKKKKYQIKVVESKVVKGSVMALIEPLEDEQKGKASHEHKTWVILEKIDGKYLVSGERHDD